MNKVIEYLAFRREALEETAEFLGKVSRLVTEADRDGFLLQGAVCTKDLKIAWLVAPAGTLPGQCSRVSVNRSDRPNDESPAWQIMPGEAVNRINYEFGVLLRQPVESTGPVVSVCLEVNGPKGELSWWEVKRLIRKVGWRHLFRMNDQRNFDLECSRLNLTESTTPEAVRDAVMASVAALKSDFEAAVCRE